MLAGEPKFYSHVKNTIALTMFIASYGHESLLHEFVILHLEVILICEIMLLPLDR